MPAADGASQKRENDNPQFESCVAAHSFARHRNGASFCDDHRRLPHKKNLLILRKSIHERINSVMVVAAMVLFFCPWYQNRTEERKSSNHCADGALRIFFFLKF